MGQDSVKTLYVGPDHCISTYESLVLLIVASDPRPGTSKILIRCVEQLDSQVTGQRGFMVVLRADAPPPGEPARAIIKESFQIFDRSMAVGTFVVEREGFVGAALRSALNMAMLAARPAFTMKVFSGVDEASRWLAGRLEHGLAADKLTAVVGRLAADYAAGTLKPTG